MDPAEDIHINQILPVDLLIDKDLQPPLIVSDFLA